MKKPPRVEVKTQKNSASVSAFLSGVKDPRRLKDCKAIAALMAGATGKPARMWGSSLVGFGDLIVRGKSREVAWFEVGFSPRKAELSLYLTMNLDQLAADLKKLGPHSRGKGCLYLKSLADVDLKVLEGMIRKSVKIMRGNP